jgi:hypothetical protein
VTDAHLPSRWGNDPCMDALTDTTWRVFCRWLMWSNEQGTDGFLPDAALRHLHVDGVGRARKGVAELVRAGIAERVGGGHRVLDWGKSQSTAEYVAHQRERKRRNQQDLRDREREALSRVTGDIAGDVTGDIDGDLPRQGKYRRSLEQNNAGTSASDHEVGGHARGCEECQRRYAFGQPPCPIHISGSAA